MSDDYDDDGPSYAVNLEHLRWGRFSMGVEGGADVSEVLFVQTAVSLDDADTQLVQQLAPVRESMEPELLGFENLMQRDLDDARVSNRLIPYLLESSAGMVRMFPSILVLLLPQKFERVDTLYLPQHKRDPVVSGQNEAVTLAYGDGDRQWAFEFTRLRKKGASFLPYRASLRVNPDLCKFAIIDGQHRAMALLALYRNLTKWPDRGKPFKEFYANHPREKLINLDRSGLSLPVTLCFFPNLHRGDASLASKDLSVIKAARKLFLDVNQNAKTPSKARQVLLDDRRVSSDFVRGIMTRIKDKPVADGGLRLWNLYYDQMEDNESSLPKISVTSVLHLQYMVRMLLLGARPHSGERLVTRTDFGTYNPATQDNNRTLVELLDWETKFGEHSASWKDETVPAEHRSTAVAGFLSTWGRVILAYLEAFPAFQALALASGESRAHLQQSTRDEDPLVMRMMFEGQGVRAVHDAIRDEMDIVDGQPYPYPDDSKRVFRIQGKRLAEIEEQAVARAAEHYWGQGKGWPTWLTADHQTQTQVEPASSAPTRQLLVQAFNTLCSRLFKTKAFQVGVLMTVGHLERKLPEEMRPLFWSADVPRLVVDQLAAYFRPSGFPGNNLGEEKQAVWARESIIEGRIVSFAERGLYRFVRDVLGGDLKDGRWQLVKYCVMEILVSGVKDVAAARTAWRGARATIPAEQLDELAGEVDRVVRDAVWQYRDRLLVHELENLRQRHRRETGHEATDAEVQAFWTDACNRLALKLDLSMALAAAELNKVRSRPRAGAEQRADADETVDSEDPPSI